MGVVSGETNCSVLGGAVPLRAAGGGEGEGRGGGRGVGWAKSGERRGRPWGDVVCAERVGGARDFPREIGSFGPRDA